MSFLDNYEKVYHPEEPAAKTEVNGEALRNLIREEINNVIGGLAEEATKKEPTKPQEPKENEKTPEDDPGESEQEE